MDHHHISSQWLTVGQVEQILNSRCAVSLSPEAEARITACREYLVR